MVNNVPQTNSLTLALYATDASMYQMQRLAVVVPVDRADVLKAILHCAEQKLPLLARGGGTSQLGIIGIWPAGVIDQWVDGAGSDPLVVAKSVRCRLYKAIAVFCPATLERLVCKAQCYIYSEGS